MEDDILTVQARAVITHAHWNGLMWETHTQESKNIVTNLGRVTIHTYLYGSGSQRAVLGTGFNFLALSNDATAPAAGDTSLVAELIGGGLSRVAATVSLPSGSGTITQLSNVFTYTGVGSQTVRKMALFDQASGGRMAHEILFPAPRTLLPNDVLTLDLSITLA